MSPERDAHTEGLPTATPVTALDNECLNVPNCGVPNCGPGPHLGVLVGVAFEGGQAHKRLRPISGWAPVL